MQAVAQIDQQRGKKGRRSIMKDVEKCAAKWVSKLTTNERTMDGK